MSASPHEHTPIPSPAEASLETLVASLAPVAEPFARIVTHVELALRRALHPGAPAKAPAPIPVLDTEGNRITLPNGRVMALDDFQTRMRRLTEPFREDEHELRPQPIGADKTPFQCRQGTKASADGLFCGGYHARSIHLTYVGHAGITDRLTEVDPFWTAEFPRNPDGSPLLSPDGVLWGKLTVLGITRDGVGDTGRQTNIRSGNAQKEVIGDFYRNAAMRFGVGAYLWSKSDAAAKKQAGQWEAEAHAESAAFWETTQRQSVRDNAERTAAAVVEATAAPLPERPEATVHPIRKDPAAGHPAGSKLEAARAALAAAEATAGATPAGAGWKKLTRKSLPMSEEKWWAAWDYFSGFGPVAFAEFKDFAMNPAHGAPEGLRDDLVRQLEQLQANAGGEEQ